MFFSVCIYFTTSLLFLSLSYILLHKVPFNVFEKVFFYMGIRTPNSKSYVLSSPENKMEIVQLQGFRMTPSIFYPTDWSMTISVLITFFLFTPVIEFRFKPASQITTKRLRLQYWRCFLYLHIHRLAIFHLFSRLCRHMAV